MKREEFVERILETVEEVVVPVKVKGFYEAKRWASGINPYAGDSVLSGIIVECEVPALVGQPLTIRKHWSYNGTHREYSEEMVERPHYEKEESEGYAFDYEEGVFDAQKTLTLGDLPEVRKNLEAAILEQVRIAVDTRPLPGVKYVFHNYGYRKNYWGEYPYRVDPVESAHYNTGNKPFVVFGRSFKKDLSSYKKVGIDRPWRVGEIEIVWNC